MQPSSEVAADEKDLKMKRICLVGLTAHDENLKSAANTFNIPVVESETGLELIVDNKWSTYFVLEEFEGPIYEAISKSKHK